MDPAGLQMNLRQNNEELIDYIKGLDSWEKEMKEKDERFSKNKSILKEVKSICYNKLRFSKLFNVPSRAYLL